MLNSVEASYYPKSGCLRFGRMLYNIRAFSESFGEHFWDSIVHNRDKAVATSTYAWPTHQMYYLSVWFRYAMGGVALPMMPTVGEIRTVVHVWSRTVCGRGRPADS